MNIDNTYQNILAELKLGHRGLVRFHIDELEELNHLLQQALLGKANEDLEKILCLVEHSAVLYDRFAPTLLQLLKASLPDGIKIFALNCARKHIIEARFQKGQRLDFDFLETIRPLLQSKNPELVEWTLRLIEACGNQGIYFLKDFDNIKPPPWKWFNSHQRAVREIITLLERRWSPFERPKS